MPTWHVTKLCYSLANMLPRF